MYKAVLCDLDGVAVVEEEYFSVRYAEKHGVDLDAVAVFFKEKFPSCVRGEADLKVELAPYLPEWGWQGSVDDFLAYWFEDERELDEEVMKQIADFRAAGIECYLATDQEKYRAAYLLEEVGFRDRFDGAFVSCDLGFKKSDAGFFIKALDILKRAPEEVIYFDDRLENVERAASLGIKAIHFTSPADMVGIL